jgi:sugar phosphate isomerase/epimerase
MVGVDFKTAAADGGDARETGAGHGVAEMRVEAGANGVMYDFSYCLNTSTIQPTPLLEKVRIAGRLGFDAVELWNDEITEFESHSSLGELKRIITDAGLRVASVIALGGWLDLDDKSYHTGLDECRRRMDQAAALGSPIIVASPPQGRVDRAHAVERYGELLRLGRRHGVRPALEFLGFVDGISTLAEARAIADATRDPDATLVVDVYHILRGGGRLEEIRGLSGSQIAIFHLDDMPAKPSFREQTDHDRVMLGDGVVDLRQVVADLRAIDYQGALSLELFNKALWALDPEDVCRMGLERMRALADA